MYWAHLFNPHDSPMREVLLYFTVEESEVWRDEVIWCRLWGSECPQELSFLYSRQWNNQRMRNPTGQWSSRPPSVSHTSVVRVWPGKETPWEVGLSRAQLHSLGCRQGARGPAECPDSIPGWDLVSGGKMRKPHTVPPHMSPGWTQYPGTGWLLLSDVSQYRVSHWNY